MKKHLFGYMRASSGVLLRAMSLVMALAILAPLSKASTDYGPAIWRPAASGHWYTGGNGHKFHVIHDIEGYYLSTISYFQRSSTQASIHYVVNGKKDYASDANPGEVSQMVRDAYYGWHARCWNTHSTGTEHEGFANNPAWFTESLYVASAGITRHLQSRFGWAMDRNHVIGHGQKSYSGWPSYASAHLGIDPYCNDHTDPGPHWNWTHYMDLCKNTVSTPSAPSTLTVAVASSTQLNLTWVDHSGIETGFKVERATAAAGPWTQIGTTAANDVTYSATGLASGTKYYFRVRAYNASGNSGYSNTGSATTKDTIPAAPASLAAVASNDDVINLTWTCSAPNEDGFKIFRSTDNVTYAQVGTAAINATTFSSTGLAGNTLYYFKVVSYNTAGNSAYSNVASDTTAPVAPSGLTATSGGAYGSIKLSWVDNSNNEVGYKIERGTAAAGPFTAIATNAASITVYTNTGLAASTTYYFRVRTYNANGHSLYSNVASFTTPNAPPVLGAIGDKVVAAGNPLTFTATATDPNATVTTTTFATFEGSADGTAELMFRKPSNSGTTAAFVDPAATNYSFIKTNPPAGAGGTHAVKAGWSFKTGTNNYWIRFNTFDAPSWANPTIALDQVVRFKIYSTKAMKVGIGVRETSTSAAYGADGGTTGTIEWIGVTNVVNGHPVPNRLLAANTWTTLSFNIPSEPKVGFTGDGVVTQNSVKGTLEEIILRGEGGTGAYTVWVDDIAVVAQNTLAYTLDAGAPSGATIERRTGKFNWTPTAGQVGLYSINVRVTDQLGAVDFQTIKVTVTGTGNNAPVLAAIGAKSINEGSALGFTATATDVDAGQTKTFTLDAGAPAGASITTAGVFSWTPTESQGPGSYPITVRVTDNGSPVSNDFETITVTVGEVNAAPVVATISNQTVSEGSPLSVSASATDGDLPANTITYSLAAGAPAGMTINSSSGAISWTPTEAQGPDVYPVTVVAKDNGSPVLSGSKNFIVTVNEANVAPVLTLGSTVTTVTEITGFEDNEDGTYSGTVMFRQPTFSSTTAGFVDTVLNETSVVETNYPDVDVNTTAKVLFVGVNFKTGTTNPWVRLTTYTVTGQTNAYDVPNPTIDLTQRVRFDVWTDKSIKVGLGVRETATGAPIGADGGTTGSIEWAGVPSKNGSAPNPSRVVSAGAWTTLEFDLPNEAITSFSSGNNVLATGKGTIEHLAIVPNGGMGAYNIYVDNFQVVKVTTNLVVDTGGTITVTNTATDSDLPAQGLTFSLGGGAPANAAIDPITGVFTWTPTAAQSPSTNSIPVIVTDDGPGALSDTKNLIVIVNKVNTAPAIEIPFDQAIETFSGQTVSFTVTATDDDVPADTLTFSLQGSVPSGATINSSTGDFSWTPPNGNSTNVITVRVTDNGTPNLFAEQTVTILVVPANAAPVLSLGTARATEKVINFESFTNNTPNEQVLFNKPFNSGTTTNYIDGAVTNYTTVTTNFPAGNANANAKVMKIGWSFKAGASNYWVRLNTYNATTIPNPTINLGARVKFNIYSTKALKVGLGVRETGTSAAIGANGGTTGTIEWIGVTNTISATPLPNRLVTASNWTTLEFDLPNEPIVAALGSGNGALAAGKGVLEHLALVGAGGTGAYTVYVDNFEVVTTATLPGTITVPVNGTLTFTASASDSDVPAQPLIFGLDADAPATATIDDDTGAFTWTPDASFAGTTNSIGVTVDDEPQNGGISKSDSKTLTVIVQADSVGVQSAEGSGSVAAGETVELTWDSTAGTTYSIQYKDSADAADWTDSGTTVTATGASSSAVVANGSAERFYRIVEVAGAGSAPSDE